MQGPAEGWPIDAHQDLGFYLVDLPTNFRRLIGYLALHMEPLGARCYDVKAHFCLSAELARRTIGDVLRALRYYFVPLAPA
jgi:hypothetical protein